MPKSVVSETIFIEAGELHICERPDVLGISNGLITVQTGLVELLERGSNEVHMPAEGEPRRVRWPVAIKAITGAVVIAEYSTQE